MGDATRDSLERGTHLRVLRFMVTHFTELTVYIKSFELARRIFVISRRWPSEERNSLTSQIRRAARSVGANLAESWGKRRYEAHFVSKLTDSDGENHEIEHAPDCDRRWLSRRARVRGLSRVETRSRKNARQHDSRSRAISFAQLNGTFQN